MFVKSSMDRDVKYSKSTGAILIKANTVTFVDDNLVTAKELKDCYGNRITIMSQENIDQYVGELANTGVPAVDDFLNGETENLPEGTKEISEAEALKLQKEAEEQAAEAARKAEEERLAKEAEEKAQEEARIKAEKEAEEARLKAEAEAKAAEEAAKAEAEKVKEPKASKKGTSAKSKGKTSSKKK